MKGQSLVELAISFVVLMLLLSGAVEFGMAFFQFVQLRDAAQEGALYGATHPSELDNIQLRARESSDTPLDLNRPDVYVEVLYSGGACEGYDNSIKVTMTYEHKVFMPFFSFFKDAIVLKADVTDTILYPIC
jgi:hypothetical protein